MVGLKVMYNGEPSIVLDNEIRVAAEGGVNWAQGYDFGEDVRDIAFDFDDDIARDLAVADLESIEGVRTELR